ncbi:MAG: hypothetical protein V4555_17290, partial [Acidobacteriota bacterium]
MDVRVGASSERPVVNPALVIEGWSGVGKVSVVVAGKVVDVPVRVGVERHLEGDAVVVYLEMRATGPVEIRIEAAKGGGR